MFVPKSGSMNAVENTARKKQTMGTVSEEKGQRSIEAHKGGRFANNVSGTQAAGMQADGWVNENDHDLSIHAAELQQQNSRHTGQRWWCWARWWMDQKLQWTSPTGSRGPQRCNQSPPRPAKRLPSTQVQPRESATQRQCEHRTQGRSSRLQSRRKKTNGSDDLSELSP